jgi:hypothetical protein
VRITYLDEAGISAHEPYVVVAGVLIDGDRQLARVEDYLDHLVKKHIPDEHAHGFVFHAADIWAGSEGIFKDRSEWPFDRRIAILKDLAAIPVKFDLVVSMGWVEKATAFPEHGGQSAISAFDMSVAAHAVAFMDCAIAANIFLREATNEYTILIAEDRDSVRNLMKSTLALCRNERALRAANIEFGEILPLERVRDTVHFAKKAESRHLQLADAATFVVMGHLLQKVRGDFLYEALKPSLFVTPKRPIATSSAS